MICPNCKREVPDTAKACGYCGHWLAEDESATVQVPQEKATVAVDQKTRGVPGWVWIVAGLVGLVLIVVIGVLAFLAGRGGDGDQADAEATVAAALAATQTAQAIPASAPEATDTPVPAATAADPDLYDGFENPAHDGRFDPDRWVTYSDPPYQLAQGDGVLVITQEGEPDDASLHASGYESVTLNDLTGGQPTFLEAKLMLDPDFHEGDVHLSINADLGGDRNWGASCYINHEGDKPQPWASCFDIIWPEQEGHVYDAEGKPIDAGTWHTFRIEIDPATMTFTYYLDGKLVGSHVPVDAEEIRDVSFSVSIGVWGPYQEVVTGYVDDVRIGRFSKAGEAAGVTEADPALYDGFDDPAHDGGHDPERWIISGELPYQVAQGDGIMVLTQEGEPESLDLTATEYPGVTLNYLTGGQSIFYEASLMLDPDFHEGDVHMTLSVDLGGDRNWSANCFINHEGGDPQPWAGCFDSIWPDQEGHGYDADGKPIDAGTWHTFRIELDPASMTFTYYVDGKMMGSHVPVDAEELRDGTFYVSTGVWAPRDDKLVGYVDDVRIGQVSKAGPAADVIEDDPALYDGFDDPAYDGDHNPERWVVSGEPPYQVAQGDGVMVLTQEGEPESVDLTATEYPGVTLNYLAGGQPIFYEASLMLDPDFHQGDVHMGISVELGGDRGWSAGCYINQDGDEPQPWAGCHSSVWPDQPGHAYDAEGKAIDAGSWHTFRIEFDPVAMGVSYFIDGEMVGSHVPVDAEEIGDGTFYVGFGVWAPHDDKLVGYVDEVRFGKVGE